MRQIIEDMDRAIAGLNAAIGQQDVPKGKSIATGCARHFVCLSCNKSAKTTKAHPNKLLCWRCRKVSPNAD